MVGSGNLTQSASHSSPLTALNLVQYGVILPTGSAEFSQTPYTNQNLHTLQKCTFSDKTLSQRSIYVTKSAKGIIEQVGIFF